MKTGSIDLYLGLIYIGKRVVLISSAAFEELIEFDLPLFTANVSDFRFIPGMELKLK